MAFRRLHPRDGPATPRGAGATDATGAFASFRLQFLDRDAEALRNGPWFPTRRRREDADGDAFGGAPAPRGRTPQARITAHPSKDSFRQRPTLKRQTEDDNSFFVTESVEAPPLWAAPASADPEFTPDTTRRPATADAYGAESPRSRAGTFDGAFSPATNAPASPVLPVRPQTAPSTRRALSPQLRKREANWSSRDATLERAIEARVTVLRDDGDARAVFLRRCREMQRPPGARPPRPPRFVQRAKKPEEAARHLERMDAETAAARGGPRARPPAARHWLAILAMARFAAKLELALAKYASRPSPAVSAAMCLQRNWRRKHFVTTALARGRAYVAAAFDVARWGQRHCRAQRRRTAVGIVRHFLHSGRGPSAKVDKCITTFLRSTRKLQRFWRSFAQCTVARLALLDLRWTASWDAHRMRRAQALRRRAATRKAKIVSDATAFDVEPLPPRLLRLQLALVDMDTDEALRRHEAPLVLPDERARLLQGKLVDLRQAFKRAASRHGVQEQIVKKDAPRTTNLKEVRILVHNYDHDGENHDAEGQADCAATAAAIESHRAAQAEILSGLVSTGPRRFSTLPSHRHRFLLLRAFPKRDALAFLLDAERKTRHREAAEWRARDPDGADAAKHDGAAANDARRIAFASDDADRFPAARSRKPTAKAPRRPSRPANSARGPAANARRGTL
ncbi:hypothetical protein M885DRAFT_510955 [Pelagophyceae sp. CCMP2097]|nr:hypothetical protein M885DRAFT_510955 [Pelagophyceae sp. CCMP2097]